MERGTTESLWHGLLERAQAALSGAENQDVALLAALAVGVLYCFLGYRLIRVLIALTGFALAALPAVILAAWLSHANAIAVGVAGLLGGIAGAVFMAFVYRAGIFCLGLLGAALIAHHLLTATELTWAPWAILGLGVVGGLLALLVERPVITVATAALGAWILLVSAALVLMRSDAADSSTVQELTSHASLTILAVWTVLTVAGTAAQFATYRKPKTAEGED